MAKHWAICQFYEPFTMGGSVWQWRRFEVEAEEVYLINKIKGFVFQQSETQWNVYELSTGGFLGVGASRADAIKAAKHNIKITPNLKEQIAKLGDTSHFQVVSSEEALKRITKGGK